MLTLRQSLSKNGLVDDNGQPIVIAEMSGNHNSSLDTALNIVDAAADTGAHALKLQTFTADSMTLDLKEGEFSITDPNSLWAGRCLFDLYEEAKTPFEWHRPILERARERGLVCFSTPFSDDAVDFLEDLNVPCYKIASFEIIDLPLVRKVALTGKPIVASTGMATLVEIAEAVETALEAGCSSLTILKCTSSYPAPPDSTNLATIPELKRAFGCHVGLSDHTLGIGVAVSSVAVGATVIEKHFTLDRSAGGVDSAFSLEPKEFSSLVTEVERAHAAVGTVQFGPTAVELHGRRKRRSLYIGEDMKAGDVLTKHNLRRIRPGSGLPPKYYDVLLGKQVNQDVRKGTPLDWHLIA